MLPRELGAKMLMLHILRRKSIHKAAAAGACLLAPGQFPLLRYLVANPDATQQELSEGLFVTPASVALSTKRMQKAGLIEKHADPNNLRCNRLSVTKTGYEAFRTTCSVFDAVDEQTFRGFTNEELLDMATLADSMIANLSDGEDTPPWFAGERNQT